MGQNGLSQKRQTRNDEGNGTRDDACNDACSLACSLIAFFIRNTLENIRNLLENPFETYQKPIRNLLET